MRCRRRSEAGSAIVKRLLSWAERVIHAQQQVRNSEFPHVQITERVKWRQTRPTLSPRSGPRSHPLRPPTTVANLETKMAFVRVSASCRGACRGLPMCMGRSHGKPSDRFSFCAQPCLRPPSRESVRRVISVRHEELIISLFNRRIEKTWAASAALVAAVKSALSQRYPGNGAALFDFG